MGVKCGGPMPGSPWSWPRLALRSKGSGPGPAPLDGGSRWGMVTVTGALDHAEEAAAVAGSRGRPRCTVAASLSCCPTGAASVGPWFPGQEAKDLATGSTQ